MSEWMDGQIDKQMGEFIVYTKMVKTGEWIDKQINDNWQSKCIQ